MGLSLSPKRCGGSLTELGGEIKTSTHVESLAALPKFDVTLCDVTPLHLARIAASRLSTAYTRRLAKYRYGPGVFKVDYALRSPIPWKAMECLRAATVHVGGSADEIAASETAMSHGRHSERPFVLLRSAEPVRPNARPGG